MSARDDRTGTSTTTRFRKGVSGNPAGRPRKAVAPTTPFSAFDIVMDRTLPVTEGGEQQDLTVEEALLLKTYQQALAGSLLARKTILKMIEKREAARAKRAPTSRPMSRSTALPSSPKIAEDPDNADEALLLLGIASPNEARRELGGGRAQLLLEPWAVQAALSRRRGALPLDARDQDEIMRTTRDAESLVWPRGSRA